MFVCFVLCLGEISFRSNDGFYILLSPMASYRIGKSVSLSVKMLLVKDDLVKKARGFFLQQISDKKKKDDVRRKY